MSSLPPEELLPVLSADLADEAAEAVLDAAARVGGRVFLPLASAPVSASAHVLEVDVPGKAERLVYLAEPVGPPTEDGFPLRIRPWRGALGERAATPGQRPEAPPNVVRARGRASARISESHAKDLALPRDGAEDLVGRALAGGKLKIEALIGRGGAGVVYKARHRELKIPVAVKVLHESFQHDIDFCRRFYAEALAASRLDHPNVTRVIDFGQEPDGLLYLAMEFLDGVELRAVLNREGRLATPRIVEIGMQVCAGLSHAHARGIVHRDIKPENLVLLPGHDDDGRPIEIVKVCDFGIAQHKALHRSHEDDGLVTGTPEYMSPEQARGDELDARSDVYAVGVVLYELATGNVPFRAERPQSVLNKHQFTPPEPPSAIVPVPVDPRLERIVLAALAKEPDDRPASMRDLRAALRDLLAPEHRGAAPSSARMPVAARAATPQAAAPAAPAPRRAPPPLPARREPPKRDAAPEWLERGAGYATYVGDPRRAPTPPAADASRAAPDDVADAIAQDPAAWMQRFARTPEPAPLAQRLEAALRALAVRGEARALWTVSAALHDIAADGAQAKDARASVAARVLRVFEDPPVLAAIAEVLLASASTDAARADARKLLVRANVAGAHGLYGARVKLAADPSVRAPFVSAMKDFGRKAWPVVSAALEKIQKAKELTRAAAELAEDLLLCAPYVGDESAGHVVVKYLRVTLPGPCRAATGAIVKLWGARAVPLLVGMVQASDDVVRVAGVAGLQKLGAIDEHVVPRLAAILLRRVPAGEELRAAAALALAHATPTAKKPAVSVLAQLVAASRDARAPSDGRVLSREDAVVVAIARSLLTLGGAAFRGVVSERAERSPDALRAELQKLLA